MKADIARKIQMARQEAREEAERKTAESFKSSLHEREKFYREEIAKAKAYVVRQRLT
jgi:hypothetical protein